MAPSVGDVTVDVDLNGKRWPNSLRRIMRSMGAEVQKSARSHAKFYSDSFDKSLSGRFRGLARSIRESVAAHRDAAKAARAHALSWSNLSHNGRQWTLIITAIMSAMAQASALGSALGGTIVALATTLAGVGAMAAVAAVGFMGLYADGVKLSQGAKETKAALSDLGGAFGVLRERVTNAIADGMAPSIQAFRGQIEALTPIVESFAAATGQQISRVFDALSSPQAFNNFRDLIEGFKPIIDSMTTAIIGFGSGLAGVLVASLPTAQKFAEAISDVGRRFGEWANSEAGRERLAEWFATAERLMPQVMALVGDLGNMLADLVTPETVASTEVLIQALRGFVPTLGDILHTLGELNIFGIIATALGAIAPVISAVLDAFRPLIPEVIPAVQELAMAISGALVAAIDTVVPMMEMLAPIIGNLITGFAGIVTAITPAIPIIAALALPLATAATIAGTVLKAMNGLFTGLSLVTKGFNLLKVAFAANPFGLILTAITAVVAGLTWFFTETELGREMWANFTQFLSEAWQNTVTFLTEALTNIGQFFSDTWNNIVTWVTEAINNVSVVIQTVTDVISSTWDTAWNAILTVAQFIWDSIVAYVTNYINTVHTVIVAVVTAISITWSNIWNTISQVASTIWNAIVGFIGDAIRGVQTVIHAVVSAISNWWSNTWNSVKSTASNIWNGIKSVIDTAVKGVRTVIENVIGAVKRWWEDTLNTMKNTARDVWNGIKTVIKGPIDAIKGFIEGLAGPINDAIGWFNSLFGAADSAQGKASQAANSGGGRAKYASGGRVFGPTRALIGEAGPEAVVPLSRPLSQVDPSVRWLSALAQGKGAPQAMASGGVAGGGRQVNFGAGSIVVEDRSGDPRRTAIETVNRIAENVGI